MGQQISCTQISFVLIGPRAIESRRVFTGPWDVKGGWDHRLISAFEFSQLQVSFYTFKYYFKIGITIMNFSDKRRQRLHKNAKLKPCKRETSALRAYCLPSMVDEKVKRIVKSSILLKRKTYHYKRQKHVSLKGYPGFLRDTEKIIGVCEITDVSEPDKICCHSANCSSSYFQFIMF